MRWLVESFPRCTHHIFLSHTAEDRDGLVLAVYRLLQSRGVSPWIDRHDYPYGRTSRDALRDSILTCRHTAFFVTDAMLAHARGWCVQELAWAELLQENMRLPGREVQSVFLPLYFVPQDDPRLPRSVWQLPRDRGRFWPGQGSNAEWAAEQLWQYLIREQQISARFRAEVRANRSFQTELRRRNGFETRVTRFDPAPLPPPG